MNLDTAGALVLVLLGAALLAGSIAWTAAGRPVWAPLSLVALAAAGVTAGAGTPSVAGGPWTTLLVVLAGAVAVVGGGPVTATVFRWVDGARTPPSGPHLLQDAGQLLRGGAWIGVLERGGVVAALVAGWPEGIAVVLAVKGLGRYPELRTAGRGGAAERFIIGTFTSVLWAVSCAGVVALSHPR